MLLIVLVMLSWSVNARAAQDVRQEYALEAPGNDAPAKQQVPSEVKSPAEESRTLGASSLMRTVAGVVVGPDGKPVAGAEVFLGDAGRFFPGFAGALLPEALPVQRTPEIYKWTMGGIGRAMRRTRTDAAGRFTAQLEPSRPEFWVPYRPVLLVVAEGFGLGYQRLQLLEDGWEATGQESPRALGNIRIRLPKMVPIRGRLLAPDGTPAEGVAVRARFVVSKNYRLKVCHCGFDFPEYWPRSVHTDAQGWFTFRGIPAGSNVYLNLFHPRFASDSLVVETGPSDIPKVEDPSRYDPRRVGPTFSHTLSPARPIEGVVTAADTGKPLSGVTLQVGASLGYPAPGSAYGQTDEQGRYRFNCHLARSYSMDVYPPPESGYLNADADFLAEPSDAKSMVRNFRLQRGKIIRGRVLDSETGDPIRGASVIFLPVVHGELLDAGDCNFYNPALTDKDGRFAVSGTSGPGVVSVETPDRSYLRSQDLDRILKDWAGTFQADPMTLTSIDVPSEGDLKEEVVIRLRRGRTVALQAVGPKGERLPWVRTSWAGIKATHGRTCEPAPPGFAHGKVVVPGLDPRGTSRVFLSYSPQKLAAAFDITPETPDGPIEVRLQPSATIAGRIVTPDGGPVENSRVRLRMSYDPEVSQFRMDGWGQAGHYWLGTALLLDESTDSDGRFLFEDLVPGVPLGLGYERSRGPMVTSQPLEPGERRDLGNLVRRGDPPHDVSVLLRLVGRIGIVPDLSGEGKDKALSVFVVPGSAAEKAGIRSGDQITALNGRLVERGNDIRDLWERLSWDDSLGRSLAVDGLRLSLLREGKPVEATLTGDLLPGFFGPKVKPLGDDLFEVTFTYRPNKPAEAVYLAGSFNDWKKTAHKMEGPDEQGRYTARLELEEGRYEYKFVLNGKTWQTDPENAMRTGSDQRSVFHVVGEL
jgi:protocatechuate 3,4-dioxygenase beta subunit